MEATLPFDTNVILATIFRGSDFCPESKSITGVYHLNTYRRAIGARCMIPPTFCAIN